MRSRGPTPRRRHTNAAAAAPTRSSPVTALGGPIGLLLHALAPDRRRLLLRLLALEQAKARLQVVEHEADGRLCARDGGDEMTLVAHDEDAALRGGRLHLDELLRGKLAGFLGCADELGRTSRERLTLVVFREGRGDNSAVAVRQ